MRVVALAALLVAGCYSPSVAPCVYACSAEKACPDGLACNNDLMCAATATTSCGEAPPIDGDVPPPEPDVIRVRVLDARGLPDPGASVLFADPTGMLVEYQRVDAEGRASRTMPNGGSATAVRAVNGVSIDYYVTTFLDLPTGSDIVAQPQSDDGTHEVLVKWDAGLVGTNGPYYVFTSGNIVSAQVGSTRTVNVSVRDRLPLSDVVVTDMADKSFAMKKMESVATGVGVMFGDSWQSTARVSGQLSNRPLAETTVGYRFSPTPALPPTGSKPGGIAMDAISAELPDVETTAVFTTANPMGGPGTACYQRYAAGTTAVSFDFTNRSLPWIANGAFSITDRSVRWTETAPTGLSGSLSSLVVAEITFNRGTAISVNWRVVGKAARVQTLSEYQTFALPDLANQPGQADRDFEPHSNDTFTRGVVRVISVDDIYKRAMMSKLDTRLPDSDYGADTNYTMACVSATDEFVATY